VQDQDPAEPPSQAPLEPDDSAEPPPHRLLTRLLTRSSSAAAPRSSPLCRCSPPCSIRRRFEAISEKRNQQTALTSERLSKLD
jgi:hypothetical protein